MSKVAHQAGEELGCKLESDSKVVGFTLCFAVFLTSFVLFLKQNDTIRELQTNRSVSLLVSLG